MFKWFMAKLATQRKNRAKNRIIKALEGLADFDDILIRSGHNRPERRQFWRDIVKHPAMAKVIAENLKH